jgi:hypothetical protein
VRERGLLEREGLDAQRVEAFPQPVPAGLQHALEIAVAQQQAALVLLDSDTLEFHVLLLGGCVFGGIGAVTGTAVDAGCLGPGTAVRLGNASCEWLPGLSVDAKPRLPGARAAAADGLRACAFGPRSAWSFDRFGFLRVGAGFEPATDELKIRCSTQ